MVKSDLVSKLVDRLGMNRKEVRVVVDTVFDSIKESLCRGEKVELRGFGSFKVKERGSREGRNPKTGERVFVPKKRVAYFKAGKDLKIID